MVLLVKWLPFFYIDTYIYSNSYSLPHETRHGALEHLQSQPIVLFLTCQTNCFVCWRRSFGTFSHRLVWLRFNETCPVFGVCRQIHKQAPPLEDIPEDCSAAMRSFLGRALERNPALRSSASELLKDDALNPPREDQPRCWSLDSALEEATHLLLRQPSQHHDTTQGRPFGSALETVVLSETRLDFNTCSPFSSPESSLYSEDSGHLRRKGSLYIDLGALSGHGKLVTGPPTSEYG